MARGKTEWGQPVGSRNVRPGEWSHRRWQGLRGGDNLLKEEGRGGAETVREWGKTGVGGRRTRWVSVRASGTVYHALSGPKTSNVHCLRGGSRSKVKTLAGPCLF